MYSGSMTPRNLRSGQRLNVYFCMLEPREIVQPTKNSAALPISQKYLPPPEMPGSARGAKPHSGSTNIQPHTNGPPQTSLNPMFSWMRS